MAMKAKDIMELALREEFKAAEIDAEAIAKRNDPSFGKPGSGKRWRAAVSVQKVWRGLSDRRVYLQRHGCRRRGPLRWKKGKVAFKKGEALEHVHEYCANRVVYTPNVLRMAKWHNQTATNEEKRAAVYIQRRFRESRRADHLQGAASIVSVAGAKMPPGRRAALLKAQRAERERERRKNEAEEKADVLTKLKDFFNLYKVGRTDEKAAEADAESKRRRGGASTKDDTLEFDSNYV